MHRTARLALLLALPLTMGSRCRELAEELPIYDKAALEVFLLHTPDVLSEYGIESEVGEVTMLEVYLYKPLDTGGESKVSGATVRAVMPDGSAVTLDEVDAGHYSALSTDKQGLYFEERGAYQVVASHGDQTWSASALSFVATEITDPEQSGEVPQGEPLTVSMASPAEAMVALVFDQEGEQVYDTLPSSAEDLLTLVDGQGVQEITIEGQALADPGIYLVGVAGIEKAEWREHSDNLYTSLSVFASGSLDAIAVSTMPLDGMAGVVMGMQGEELLEYGIEVPEQAQAMLYGVTVDLDQGLDEQPMTGASAQLSWGSGAADLVESAETDGLYEVSSETAPGLVYREGQEYAFTLNDGEEIYRLAMTAPEPPTLNAPEPMSYHAPGTDLSVNCPGGRDLCFAVLLDGEGVVLWDDMPTAESIDAILAGEQGTPGGEAINLPGGLFTAQGQIYAIGLLGLVQLGDSGWSDSLNPEAVDMYIGTTAFTAVTTVQLP
jgi:hypothetical protein